MKRCFVSLFMIFIVSLCADEDHSIPVHQATQYSLEDLIDIRFVNEQQMPLMLSPKSPMPLSAFHAIAKGHREEIQALLTTYGALLIRGFPVDSPEDFAATVQGILGRQPINYKGGEASRKQVVEGVYTSTEAPSQFQIPLHNELTCTDNPCSYISFYCDVAPAAGMGQTILGKTETVSQELSNHSEVWDLFNGRNLRYISRHPPEGSFFSTINVTHKSWQESFDTHDRDEVERICREKGFEFKWKGDWVEVARLAPAIHETDEHFDFPFWFNQAHLYHANPRLRGGRMNHFLASLIYILHDTRQYDIEFEDGSPIPQEIIYIIYDVLEKNTIKVDWQKGDILLLDNFKAMHGRATYSGPRRILVSMFQ